MQKRQSGYGLLEIALGIAIAALIIAGSMMYYQRTNLERKASETLELVMAVKTTVDTLSNGQSSYAGITQELVAQSAMLPNKFRNRNRNGLRHPFGGCINISRSTDDAQNRLKIVLYDVPQAACLIVATKDTGSAMFIVNNNASVADGSNSGRGFARGGAMTPQQAQQTCTRARTNIMAWEFN